MYNTLIAVLNKLIEFTFKTGTAKAGVGLIIGAIMTLLYALIIELLPSNNGILFNIPGVHPIFWYLFDAFALQSYMSAILGAYSTRFLIRRIPFVG